MTLRLRDIAERWRTAGRAAVVVEVIEALGSTPREAGTRMLVACDEAIGTIGGGHLELKAIARARTMLRTGRVDEHLHRYPLGPALGQCCGGSVTLLYRALDAVALDCWNAPRPLFHLQLYGAGHVGRAIATLLATLEATVDWIDERDDGFPAATTLGSPWPERIRRVSTDVAEAEVRLAPAGGFYLVLTHRHDLDLRIAEAILARADFGFFGLIGSATKRRRFIHRFEAHGLDADAIDRMTCPIGIAGIDGKEPEVIAAGVVAQLLEVASARRRADGALSAAAGARLRAMT